MSTHMFVVPAFGEPPWLDRCLQSIQAQSVPARILITTSTPNAYLTSAAHRRGIPIVVNPVSAGIASDWNFALAQADAEWVSLAHQDDWYSPGYLESCIRAAGRATNPVLVFTDATEVFEEGTDSVANVYVKRAICGLVFLGRRSIASTAQKRFLLSFGNPIPCPSVMLNRRALPRFSFPDGWTSNLDWRAWLTLAREPGAFVHVPRPLVHRTLHPGAATTRSLSDRAREDGRMFEELWPAPIASALGRLYAGSRIPYSTLRNG